MAPSVKPAARLSERPFLTVAGASDLSGRLGWRAVAWSLPGLARPFRSASRARRPTVVGSSRPPRPSSGGLRASASFLPGPSGVWRVFVFPQRLDLRSGEVTR